MKLAREEVKSETWGNLYRIGAEGAAGMSSEGVCVCLIRDDSFDGRFVCFFD